MCVTIQPSIWSIHPWQNLGSLRYKTRRGGNEEVSVTLETSRSCLQKLWAKWLGLWCQPARRMPSFPPIVAASINCDGNNLVISWYILYFFILSILYPTKTYTIWSKTCPFWLKTKLHLPQTHLHVPFIPLEVIELRVPNSEVEDDSAWESCWDFIVSSTWKVLWIDVDRCGSWNQTFDISKEN